MTAAKSAHEKKSRPMNDATLRFETRVVVEELHNGEWTAAPISNPSFEAYDPRDPRDELRMFLEERLAEVSPQQYLESSMWYLDWPERRLSAFRARDSCRDEP